MTSIFDHFSFTLKPIPTSDYCHLLPKFLRMVRVGVKKLVIFREKVEEELFLIRDIQKKNNDS